MNNYQILFFDEASKFIDETPETDKAKILASIKTMETDYDLVHTKILRKAVRELIVKKYRLIFFMQGQTIFFTHGFIKKSQKTPAYEIDRAENIYKQLKEQ